MFDFESHTQTHLGWSKCAFTFHTISYKNGTWFNNQYISRLEEMEETTEKDFDLLWRADSCHLLLCRCPARRLDKNVKNSQIPRFFGNIIRWPIVYCEFLQISCKKVICTSPPFTKHGLDCTPKPSPSAEVQSIDIHRLCNVAREQKQASTWIRLGSDRETCQPFHFACSHSAPGSDSIRWDPLLRIWWYLNSMRGNDPYLRVFCWISAQLAMHE